MKYLTLSQEARDEAMARVQAPTDWKEQALAVVHTLAEQHPTVTSDDVWYELELQGVDRPQEPRAMGSIFAQARAKGWIEPTHIFRPCEYISRHAAPIRVWSSRLFD